MKQKISIDKVNALSQHDFVERFFGVYEHSAWVAEQSWQSAPFSDFQDLVASFADTVAKSNSDLKLDLLRAHPRLSGKANERKNLTSESQEEQKSAGLNSLDPSEVVWLEQFNDVYSEAFGFPFIIAVKNHSKDEIFTQMEARLKQCVDDEIKEALLQVDKIARIRLSDLVVENLVVENSVVASSKLKI